MEVAEPEMVRPVRVVVAKPVAETERAEVEALVTASKIAPTLSPKTINLEKGVTVPIPMYPLVSIVNLDLDAV